MTLSDDDFTLFGLPRRFQIDRAALDARWRQLQSEVHPDRFAAEGAAAQRGALQWSVRVNEAYRRLRDPLSRAAYLCGLHGAAIDAEDNTAMPAAFLMQQMAWREALDEADSIAAVEAIAAKVGAAEAERFVEIERLLDRDAGPDARAAADHVRALMFDARFAADIDRRLEALGQ